MRGEDLIRDALKSIQCPKGMVDGVIVSGEGQKKEKKKRKYIKKAFPKVIDNWITSDFVRFASRIFYSRYGKKWTLNFSAQCKEVLKIKDCLSEIFGFCNNAILKDYIEWFFEHKSDVFVEKNGEFFFSYLCYDKILSLFYVEYSFKHPEEQHDNEEQYNNEEQYDSIDTPEIKSEDQFADIENTFLLNDEDFVSKYGVIIAVNWLITSRKFSAKEAIHYVYSACDKIHSKGLFDNVIKSTVKYNPYPGRLEFLDANKIAKKINPLLSLCVEITIDNRADLPI